MSPPASSGRNELRKTEGLGTSIPRLNGAGTAQRAVPTNFGFRYQSINPSIR